MLSSNHEPSDSFSSTMNVCYEILLYLNSRMAKLHAGDIFEFTTTDPNAQEQIPPWCEMRGYSLLSIDALSDGQWRFLIKK